MKVILYQFWRSTASWRVRWALAIKGVEFESVPVDILAGEHVRPEHLARNPIGHVPALAIDGQMLAESVAIIEYLEETRPSPPLFPTEPLARARVRQLVEIVNSATQPLQNPVVYRRHSADSAERKAWIQHFNVRGLTALERVLTDLEQRGERGRFAVGDALTAADLFIAPQVATARRHGVDLDPFPRAVAVETKAFVTPHARGALPENQPGAPC